MANQTVRATFVGVDKLTPVVAGINNTMANFKKDAMTGFGLAAGYKFTDLAARSFGALKDIVVQSIRDASNLEQAFGKLDAVFGSSAKEIIEFSRISANALGLSKRVVFEYTGGLGNLLQATGLARDQTAEMSLSLVRLAADVAAFNNRDVKEVLVAFQAGLVGEAEPARRLGVFISQARVEQYLLERGVVKTKKEITEAMKVQARFNLIVIDTKRQQGQVAREYENLAVQQMRLEANLENIRARLGEAVIPIVTAETDRLATFISDVETLIQRAEGLIQGATAGDTPTPPPSPADSGLFPNNVGDQRKDWEQLRDFAVDFFLAPFGIVTTTTSAVRQLTDDAKESSTQLYMLADGIKTVDIGLQDTAESADKSAYAIRGMEMPGVGGEFTKYSPKAQFEGIRDQLKAFQADIRFVANNPNFIRKLVRQYARITSSPEFKELESMGAKGGFMGVIADTLVGNVKGYGSAVLGGGDGTIMGTLWTPVGKKLGKQLGLPAGQEMSIAVKDELENFTDWPLVKLFGQVTIKDVDLPPGFQPVEKPIEITTDSSANSGGEGEGGPQAFGGRVRAGRRYLVGERGPEWLVMGSNSGQIVPNAGGGDIVVSVDGERLFRIMNKRMGRALAMGV